MKAVVWPVSDEAWLRPFASHAVYVLYGVSLDVESVIEVMDNTGAPDPVILRAHAIRAIRSNP